MNIVQYFEYPRINLTGAVDESMIKDLDRQIKITPYTGEQPVVVTLTSGGGSVGYARAIYEELSLLQEETELILMARGICLSAAVTMAMAVPQAKRLATPNTKFLIHEGSRSAIPAVNGPLSARQIQIANILTDLEDDREEGSWVTQVIAEGCQQPYRKVEKKARKGLWLTGKEAVRFGLVSNLLTKSAEP